MRLFGHPVHVMVIHFPIALLTVAVFWDALALWSGESFCWSVAFWSIVLGLAASVPAAGTGLMDYAHLGDDSAVEKTANFHLSLMFGAVSVFGVSLVVRGAIVPETLAAQWSAAGLDLCGSALLGAGAWFGGELVLRHDVGRVKTAKPESSPERAVDANRPCE